MAATGGYGVTLKIMVSTTLTAVANVIDVDFPKFVKFIAESTGHDATSGYYTAVATGKRKLESFTATLAWDSVATTHAAIVTAFDSDAAVSMSIQDPDGVEIIAFSAHIEAITRISRQEEVYQAEVTIHPTGVPTIT
jgi:formylmethanofuran dehydrogenase subunit E-like metal-binding protein